MTVWIAVGSNQDPEKHIRDAAEGLRKDLGPGRSSRFYRTSAIGDDSGALSSQPDFLNGVWAFEYTGDSAHVEKILKDREKEAGRVRDPGNKYADRTLDLDLLGTDKHFLDPGEIAERPFLSHPLKELQADLSEVVTLTDIPSYRGVMKEELAFSREIQTILGSA